MLYRIIDANGTDVTNQYFTTIADPSVLASERKLAEYNRIQAIKCYRDRTGLGLKECKDAIDTACPPMPYQAVGLGSWACREELERSQREHRKLIGKYNALREGMAALLDRDVTL